MHRLENIKIKGRFNYEELHEISTEGRQKLSKINPETLAQASRIRAFLKRHQRHACTARQIGTTPSSYPCETMKQVNVSRETTIKLKY